jgi:hypothetical protein
MAKGDQWERKALLKELREKHGFSEDEADSMGRASNATTSLVLEKLNAVGVSPEQQKEDLNTFLEAHVARLVYEEALKNDPDKKGLFIHSFIMYFLAAILTALGTVMYLGGKDPITSAFILVMGVAMIPITFYLRRLDKSISNDNAEQLELYKEDYQQVQAKLDKLLTRMGDEVSAEDTQTDEELEAEVEKYLDDNF